MRGLRSHRILILVAVSAMSFIIFLGVLLGFEAPSELELLLFTVTTPSHMTILARDLFASWRGGREALLGLFGRPF